MEDNYSKAYKEVIEILKYVPEESVNKIPQEMRNMFKSKMDENYPFEIDTDKPFEQQELLEETKAILANIFRDYWATDIQRERILEKEKQDRIKYEENKKEKYNIDVFKEKKLKQQEKLNEENNNLPVEVKKQNVFQKLIEFIKGIFNIN